MMKILIIRPWARVGYGNSYNVQGIGLAKALIKKGHQCDLVYFNGKNEDKIEFFPFDQDKILTIYSLKGIGIAGNGILYSLKNMLSNYDIIQTSEYEQWTSWYLYTYFPEKTILYHGPYYSDFKKKYNMKCKITDFCLLPFTKKSKVTAITKSDLAKEFLESKGIIDSTTIGVGLDTDRFKVDHDANSFVESLKIHKNNKKYLLYIGLIEERRHVDLVIDIFNNVHNRDSNVELVLVGKKQKEYGEKLFNTISNLGLNEFVHYKEILEQQHIGDLYQICDLFVFPTQYEIFGMVLLESMFFGLPVISSYNGGASVLIKNGYNGYIMQDFDVEKWTEKTIDILGKRNEVGANASKTIVNNFLWDCLADKFIEVYNKKLNS